VFFDVRRWVVTDEQVEKLCCAIRSLGWDTYLAGAMVFMGLLFNGCGHK
jgi:hypothetical protein